MVNDRHIVIDIDIWYIKIIIYQNASWLGIYKHKGPPTHKKNLEPRIAMHLS